MVETQKCFIRLLVPQSSAAVYKCGPSSGAGCGTHIYIYRWFMGVINNDANIAPSLDGEKLHVGCCVSTSSSRSIPPPPGTTERLSVKYEKKRWRVIYPIYMCVRL
jgi:hypothetical protein